MYKKHTVLAIIPARSGSKGVPKKNIHPLLGKPLIAYSIESGKKSKLIDRLIVSSDSLEIIKIARKYGAEAPFHRPPEIATDTSTDIEFYKHALIWFQEHESWQPDLVLNLRPTAPLRSANLIDNCIKKVVDLKADGLKTVSETDKHPHKMWRLKNEWLDPFLHTDFRLKNGPDMPRQQLEKIYWQNAVVDVTKPKFILENNKVFGDKLTTVITPLENSIDLDTPFDFIVAESILKSQSKRINQ